MTEKFRLFVGEYYFRFRVWLTRQIAIGFLERGDHESYRRWIVEADRLNMILGAILAKRAFGDFVGKK